MTKPITINVKVAVRRDYGAEEVEFSGEIVVTVANADERHNAYARLMEAMYNEHERYTQEFLPRVPNSMGSLAPRPDEGEWHPAESVELEIKDRKRYYSVKGGKYSAHGVRVWNEVLRAATWLEFMELNDHMILQGWEMNVVKGDGGLKVAKFRKVEIG